MEIEAQLRDKWEDILKIVARHGARNVRVFGSVARGRERRDSDLDIIVKLDPEQTLLDLIAIKQDLEDLLGCKVDVVTEEAISPYIRGEVLKEAVAI